MFKLTAADTHILHEFVYVSLLDPNGASRKILHEESSMDGSKPPVVKHPCIVNWMKSAVYENAEHANDVRLLCCSPKNVRGPNSLW